jgi:hypothetical protein
MALRMRTASGESDGSEVELFVPDSELAGVLRTATRLILARVESTDRVQAVLGTVAAELGVACGRLYDHWEQQQERE